MNTTITMRIIMKIAPPTARVPIFLNGSANSFCGVTPPMYINIAPININAIIGRAIFSIPLLNSDTPISVINYLFKTVMEVLNYGN